MHEHVTETIPLSPAPGVRYIAQLSGSLFLYLIPNIESDALAKFTIGVK
jgi:hypothetical protein